MQETLSHKSRNRQSLSDVIRCRVICKGAEELLALENKLLQAADDHVPVAKGKLRLLRTKNKFSPKLLSPTHFRCMLNNVELKCGARRTYVELQVTACLEPRGDLCALAL